MISLIIGTYNGEAFIEKCLNSVFSQTIAKELLEVIVVDDGSTDGTVELLKEYEKKHTENMTLILCEKNSKETLLVTRNIGVDYANGEYILFMDQDDWYRQDAFELLHNKIEADNELDYVEYAFHYTDYDGNITQTTSSGGECYVFDIKNEKERVKLAQCGILPGATQVWTKIYRKSFLIDNNIYHNEGEKRTGYSDNYFSGMVVTYCKKFAKYCEPLYFYRNYVGSYSQAKKINDKNQFERCKVGLVYLEECNERELIQEKGEFIEFIFFRIFLLKTFLVFVKKFEPIPYDALDSDRKSVV